MGPYLSLSPHLELPVVPLRPTLPILSPTPADWGATASTPSHLPRVCSLIRSGSTSPACLRPLTLTDPKPGHPPQPAQPAHLQEALPVATDSPASLCSPTPSSPLWGASDADCCGLAHRLHRGCVLVPKGRGRKAPLGAQPATAPPPLSPLPAPSQPPLKPPRSRQRHHRQYHRRPNNVPIATTAMTLSAAPPPVPPHYYVHVTATTSTPIRMT